MLTVFCVPFSDKTNLTPVVFLSPNRAISRVCWPSSLIPPSTNNAQGGAKCTGACTNELLSLTAMEQANRHFFNYSFLLYILPSASKICKKINFMEKHSFKKTHP